MKSRNARPRNPLSRLSIRTSTIMSGPPIQDDHSGVAVEPEDGQVRQGKRQKDADGNGVPLQFVTDSKNNLYLLNFGGTLVGYVDKTTGIARPTRRHAQSRPAAASSTRGQALVFGIQRPTPSHVRPEAKKIHGNGSCPSNWGDPYALDYSASTNEAWTGSEADGQGVSSRVKTGQFTRISLPRSPTFVASYRHRGNFPAVGRQQSRR